MGLLVVAVLSFAPVSFLEVPRATFAALFSGDIAHFRRSVASRNTSALNLLPCIELASSRSLLPAHGTAVVVAFSALRDLAVRHSVRLGVSTSRVLNGLIAGGVNLVILTGDAGEEGWDDASVAEVAEAVAGAVDQHGTAVRVGFAAIPPALVRCLDVGGMGAGVLWAAAVGRARAVLALDHATYLARRALFFDTTAARMLPQDADENTDVAEANVESAGDRWPVSRRIRDHFVACGGGPAPCVPGHDSRHLCSRWLRPVMQIGLCHDPENFELGRHDTVAANSPLDASRFSGPRLLEEVSTLTLRPGSLWPPFSSLDTRLVPAANRLVDVTAAWMLVDVSVVGAGGRLVLEAVFGAIGGNLTVLAPGRLCNVTASAAEGSLDESHPVFGAAIAVSAAAAASQVIHALRITAMRDGALAPSNISGGAMPVLHLRLAVAAATEILLSAQAVSLSEALALDRWMQLFAASMALSNATFLPWSRSDSPSTTQTGSRSFSKSQTSTPSQTATQTGSRTPSPASRPPTRSQSRSQSASFVNVTATPTTSGSTSRTPAPSPSPRTLADVLLPPLRPEPRQVFPQCFPEHHSVRDIVMLVNFNHFNFPWGPQVMQALLGFYGPYFPAIIGVHTRRLGFAPEYPNKAGMPELNLDRCDCPGGSSDGYYAQYCAAVALTRYSGHLGYVVANDDALWMPWNTLANRVDWLWHKRKTPGPRYDWTYDCTTCQECRAWQDFCGPATLRRVHPSLPPWMLAMKVANFNRTDGVSCSVVDAYYVPGQLSPVVAWFLAATAAERTFVELATSTSACQRMDPGRTSS